PARADFLRQHGVATHTRRVAQDHRAGHADELVGLAVGRFERVDLAEPRVLRRVERGEHLVERPLEIGKAPVRLLVRHGDDDSYAAPRSARSAARGRNTGIVTSSEVSWNRTSSGMPTSSASNSQSTTLVIMRGPSSRSTTGVTYVTRSGNGGRSLRRTI